MAANPTVEVVIDHYDEDWSLLRGVLLHCEAEVAGKEDRERAWKLIREKYPQYEEIDWRPRLTPALRIRSWASWGVGEGAGE